MDDTTGEILGYVMEKLFQNKALDVFYTPIYMKKNRPAVKLEVLCNKEDEDKLKEVIFKETSTIGIRTFEVDRTVMDREIEKLDTIYGKIRVKKSTYNDIIKYSPEYEDCKKIAIDKQMAIKKVYNEVMKLI
ncbi:MAG: nickel insertion protein [Tissierella sp.]|uniref:nickel insertion protein n=1 Tax=Tissierella sp. TaxID=41274 RepID=UPI003F97566E